MKVCALATGLPPLADLAVTNTDDKIPLREDRISVRFGLVQSATFIRLMESFH
jgi:hypothetical protein